MVFGINAVSPTLTLHIGIKKNLHKIIMKATEDKENITMKSDKVRIMV